MPKVHRSRSTEHQANLARRVHHERVVRGWSYEGLAKRMTDAGFPLDRTAVFRLEKGDPPRVITFDEAVGFTKVFGIGLAELTVPMELIEHTRAVALVDAIESLEGDLVKAVHGLEEQYVALLELTEESPEVINRVRAYWQPNDRSSGAPLLHPVDDLGQDLAAVVHVLSKKTLASAKSRPRG